MKKLFFATLAAISLLACSKEEGGTPGTTGDPNISLALKIDRGLNSRAIQKPGEKNQLIQSMIIEVFNESKSLIETKVLSASQISAATGSLADLNDAARIVIEDVDSRAEYIKIWGFQAAGVNTIPTLNGTINDNQMSFDMIPFYPAPQTAGGALLSTTDANGFVSVNKSSDPAPGPASGGHDGHKIWTAQATLAPYLARFEMKPTTGITAKTSGDEGDMDLFPAGTTIAITGLYMNNIKDTPGAVIHLNGGNNAVWGSGEWAENNRYYGTGTPSWNKMYNAEGTHGTAQALDFGANADCYNLYAQSGSPHAVVRVLVTIPGEEPKYGFITIKDFRVDASTLLSADGVQTGKIYKVNLDMVVKPSDVTPDPESATADLYAQVTILDWDEVNLTPEL